MGEFQVVDQACAAQPRGRQRHQGCVACLGHLQVAAAVHGEVIGLPAAPGQGFQGGLIVLDDIIKGRKKANSRKHRDEVWDWAVADVLSRAQGGSSVIVNGTRWHEDDPIGRILAGKLNEGGGGWPFVLSDLKSLLETGTAFEF